jgi:DNA mismatch endonuclease (patch repair protein)
MVDTLSQKARSERMARVRGKNTKPEMLVRRLVHGMGFRYRLHGKDLPGRPDLVFSSRKKIIFVHGCFWHRHSDSCCKLARWPKSRLDFWRPKLEANAARDGVIEDELKQAGWKVLTVWECELKDQNVLKARLEEFLSHEID